MADKDRDVVINPCKMFQSRIEAIVGASGVLLNKCVCNMYINFFRNFHSNVYTLTIYFIALNESVGFVLIYRPHPVVSKDTLVPTLDSVTLGSHKAGSTAAICLPIG
jgi:hypothetical protein